MLSTAIQGKIALTRKIVLIHILDGTDVLIGLYLRVL